MKSFSSTFIKAASLLFAVSGGVFVGAVTLASTLMATTSAIVFVGAMMVAALGLVLINKTEQDNEEE